MIHILFVYGFKLVECFAHVDSSYMKASRSK
jgi:hypothetical protein